MNGAEFDIIKRRGEGYADQYQGRECPRGMAYGRYIVSAKDAEQAFRKYCAGGQFPIFEVSSDDTHAVPFPKEVLKARDYRELINSGCKIGYIVSCVAEDKTEIKKHRGSWKLLVDYAEAAVQAENDGISNLLFCGLVHVCASSSDGKGITIEQEIFGLLCKMSKQRDDVCVYLQTGECNDYANVLVSQRVVSAYLGIKNKNERKKFVQELQEEANAQIVQCKENGLVCNCLYLSSERLMEMAHVDESGHKTTVAQKKFADSPIVGRIGIGIFICLSIATLGVSVKFGIDMVQHKDNTDTIVFGVSCGACILFGAVLLAMIIVKCKFSQPSKDFVEPDVTSLYITERTIN